MIVCLQFPRGARCRSRVGVARVLTTITVGLCLAGAISPTATSTTTPSTLVIGAARLRSWNINY